MSQKIHDLSNVVSARFKYRLSGANEGDPMRDFNIDVSEAMLELRLALPPTAFNPTGDVDEAGNPLIGLQQTLLLFQKNEPVPEHLPTIQHLFVAARKALKIPADAGLNIVIQLFALFVQETGKMYEAKKGTPGSPDSSASTPA